MRSTLIAVLVLATSVSQSRGQESLPASTVFDSVRIGSLVYRAATTLTYPKHDSRDGADIKGDLATLVTITNTGSARSAISLARCALTVRAFLNPEYSTSKQFTGFPDSSPCFNQQIKVSLEPGESRQFFALTRKWKHGQWGILGPLHFVDLLQLRDTVVRLRGGTTKFASDLAGLDYHATSSVKGVAPARLMTQVTISNHGVLPVSLSFGDCPVKLRAFQSPDKSGRPAWRSEASGPPWAKPSQLLDVCTLGLRHYHLAPGYSSSPSAMGMSIPTYEVLGDTLQAGQYYFAAHLALNSQTFTVDAGSALLPEKQKPLPKSRMMNRLEFSGSARRLSFRSGATDSLEVQVTIRNIDRKPQRMLTDTRGSPGCVYIGGYQDRAKRDAYYLRPAYEAQWIARPCPLRVPELELEPGESRTFANRIPAPPGNLSYLFGFEFSVDPLSANSFYADFAVDEEGNSSRMQ